MLLKQWDNREDVALDITVVHPLQPSGTLTVDGAKRIIRQAGEAKERYYGEACSRAHIGFTPGVMDTWGGIHGTGTALWKAVVKRAVCGLQGPTRAASVTALRRGLVVAIMRGVASQLETMQTTCPPRVDGLG